MFAFVCSKNPADAPTWYLVTFVSVQNMCMKRTLWACPCDVSDFLCVCVCLSRWRKKGGSLQQETREWSEGNRKEMTRLSKLPLSLCCPEWKLGHTHTHTQSLLLLWLWWKLWYTGSETQDGNHWTWRTKQRRSVGKEKSQRNKERQMERDVERQRWEKNIKKDKPDLSAQEKFEPFETFYIMHIYFAFHKSYITVTESSYQLITVLGRDR